MAKYTILLKDYLQDHELPVIFDEITGFEDLFIERYFDREIGFETEDLFEVKLEHSAKLLIPDYKKRITAYDNAIDKLNNNIRRTKSKTTDLPVDSQDAEPSQVNEVEETGGNINDALVRIKFYEDSKYNAMNDLLERFNDLFMLIY